MRNKTIKSIILGHKNFNESHKLIFLYNEEYGKITTIAKGACKINSKFTGHLESLNISSTSLYFSSKNIILTDIETIENFKNIRNDFIKLKTALQINEITNKVLFENLIIEDLIPLITITLKTLEKNNNSTHPPLILTTYIIKLLDKIGLMPDFKLIKKNSNQKYIKFFNFIKTQNFSEILKINLSKKEEKIINQKLSNFLYEYSFLSLSYLSPFSPY